MGGQKAKGEEIKHEEPLNPLHTMREYSPDALSSILVPSKREDRRWSRQT